MKSYLINLAVSTARLAFMADQFARLNIEFERFAALTPEQAAAHPLASKLDLNQARRLSGSELGCLLSHCAIWRLIADGIDPYAAVFEDDVHLSPLAAQILLTKLSALRGPWVLKLEAFATSVWTFNHKPLDGDSFSAARLAQSHPGTAAYIISKAAARRLLRGRIPARPTDALLFDINRQYSIRSYQLVPAVAVQDMRLEDPSIPTTIVRQLNEAPVSAEFPLMQRIRGRLLRTVLIPHFAQETILTYPAKQAF